MNQIKTRTRRIDADEEKLTTQSKIDRKRNRPELIDFSAVPPCQRALKLFNNALQDCLIHPRKNPRLSVLGSDYSSTRETIVDRITLATNERKENSNNRRERQQVEKRATD